MKRIAVISDLQVPFHEFLRTLTLENPPNVAFTEYRLLSTYPVLPVPELTEYSNEEPL